MASKEQINGRVPDFMWKEWEDLRVELRRLGANPTDGDLIAALVHAARSDVSQAKLHVEDYVKYELEVEERDGS